MKRTNKFIVFLLCFILMLSNVGAFAADGVYKEYYVSYDNGSDSNDGLSAQTAFKTVKYAKEAARAASEDMTGDIVINLMSGNHFLEDTLYFETSDSGKNGHRIVYRGDGKATVSGGRMINGFVKSSLGDNVYEAKLSGQDYVYNIYVNGVKRNRASSERMITAISNWDDPNTNPSADGLYIKKSDLGLFDNAEDMQFMWFSGWMQCYVNVEEILPDPVNPDRVIARMDKRVWNVSGAKYRTLSLPFYLQNARELMDTPGEFYFDRKAQTLYYIPEEGEDMASAEVIVPEVEKLMDFYGASDEAKVENISFEGITFAHTAWDALASQSTTGTQAQMWGNSYNDIACVVPGAIELEYTKNISFNDNVFFGLGQVGLYLTNAADNTDITGNAFYGLGDAAIVVGLPGMRDNYPTYDIYDDGKSVLVDGRSLSVPAGDVGMRNLAFDQIKIAASHYIRGNADYDKSYLGVRSYYRPMRNWVKESDYSKFDGTWHSDPDAVGKEKAWVRYDLDRHHKLSEIHLLFDPAKTEVNQRKGYEVLISNDKEFRTYDVVAKQSEDSGSVAKFAIPTELRDNKYRYVMVRTLAPTQLALSDMYIFTEDLKPCVAWDRPRGVNISNNIISGVGQAAPCSGGLNVFSGDDVMINHNEFYNLPYSAIMAGWGWVNQYVSTDNIEIGYNHIEDVCKILNDGAGIYTLGRQYGTHVHDNFVKNITFGKCAYYLDEGTSSTVWENNAGLGINSETFFLNVNTVENTVRNIYSDNTTAGYTARAEYNTVSPVVEIEAASGYPEEVTDIIAKAGLEAGYQHLRKYADIEDVRVPYSEDLFKTTDSSVRSPGEKRAQTLLAEGNFGTKKGQFSYEYLFKLTRAYKEYANASDKNAKAQALLDTLADRYNYINEADSDSPEGIACIYADGALSMKLDAQNKAAELTFTADDSLSGKTIEVVCSDGYKLAYNFGKKNLTSDVKIPLLNKSTGRYEQWILKAQRAEPLAAGTVLTADTWYKNGVRVMSETDGGAYLSPSDGEYISSAVPAVGDTAVITFSSSAPKSDGTYTFCIGKADDNAISFVIELKDGKINLISRDSKGDTQLSSKEAVLSSGRNVLKYTITKEADKVILRAELNGGVEIHAASAKGPDSCLTSFVPAGSGIIVY